MARCAAGLVLPQAGLQLRRLSLQPLVGSKQPLALLLEAESEPLLLLAVRCGFLLQRLGGLQQLPGLLVSPRHLILHLLQRLGVVRPHVLQHTRELAEEARVHVPQLAQHVPELLAGLGAQVDALLEADVVQVVFGSQDLALADERVVHAL